MQLMRTRAIGLSPTSTQSTPASFSSAAPWSILFGLSPRGGSTSTLMMNSRALTLRARGESESSDGVGSLGVALSSTLGSVDTTATVAATDALPLRPSADRIAAMCDGVVPQQPPMIEAPASANRRAYSAKYSGV